MSAAALIAAFSDSGAQEIEDEDEEKRAEASLLVRKFSSELDPSSGWNSLVEVMFDFPHFGDHSGALN
jgi:hypothetical protein